VRHNGTSSLNFPHFRDLTVDDHSFARESSGKSRSNAPLGRSRRHLNATIGLEEGFEGFVKLDPVNEIGEIVAFVRLPD